MTDSGLPFEPEWRQFLNLGEQMLKQPDASTQTELIAGTISSRLECQAHVWLSSPFYPLPGEPEMVTLPEAEAPEIVHEAHTKSRTLVNNPPQDQPGCAQDGCPAEAALPLAAQGSVLGVVYAARPHGPAFTTEELEYLEGLVAHSALAMQSTRQVMIKNWRNDQLALVRSVSDQVANVVDMQDLCARVTRLIQETFNYYYVAIFTLDSSSEYLELQAGASQVESIYLQPGFSLRVGEGIIGHAAESGDEVLVQDVHQEPLYRYIDALPQTYSEVVLPLRVENRILGVLDVQSDQPNGFHDTDRIVLRSLANNIALAIDGAKLYHDLQRQNEQMSAVFDITHAITSILDLDSLLENVVSLLQERFGYSFVHVFTVHPGRGKVIYRSGSGARSRAMHELELQYDLNDPIGIIPWVARSGMIKVANNVAEEPLYRPSELPPLETRSEMAIPLIYGGDVLGVLDIQNDQTGAFDQNDISLFEVLGGGIATAIRNANLYRSERWRRQVSDSMSDVAGLITANMAIDELLEYILKELERHLPCDSSAIWLTEETGNGEEQNGPGLRLAVVHGIEAGKVLHTLENKSVEGWMSHGLRSRRPVIRKPTDPYGPLGLAMEFPKEYSSISAPLRYGGKPVGLLTLANRSMGRYGSEAQAMTTTFANYAAVAIQNSRLFADAQAQAWISTVLLQVAEASQATNTVDDLLSTMVRLTPLLVGVKKCGIFLWEETRQAFILKSWYGIEPPRHSSLAFDEHTTPAFARLRATQANIFIQDAGTELKLPAATIPKDTGTLVMLPLLAHGNLLGAFLVAHESSLKPGIDQPFDQQTLSILQGVAHQTAIALENLSLLEARQEEGYVTAVMLQVAQAVASQNDLDDILDTIVHLMPILVGIDACLIYLWDENLQEFYPAQVYTGRHEEEEMLISRTFAAGEFELLDRVMENHSLFAPMSEPDIPPDEWPGLISISAEDFSSLSAYTSSSWLIGFPLSVKGETFGVLLAKDQGVSPSFRERRLEIISGVAQQVALAIQNEHLNDEKIEHERMDREFQLAREIQQTFLPSYMPHADGWEVDAEWHTARTVGGDFYDIFRVSEKKLALVIADVSDKGLAAALYMTVTRTLVRASARVTTSPAELLQQVNNLLVADAQNGMYVTAVFAIVDLDSGTLTYASAGHNQPLLLHTLTGSVERLQKGGMAMAVLEGNTYKNHTLTLDPGDCLVLYTDGVTEQFSPGGEIFGEERLIDILSSTSGRSVKHLLHALNDALDDFRQGEPSSDDVTLLTVHRLALQDSEPDNEEEDVND